MVKASRLKDENVLNIEQHLDRLLSRKMLWVIVLFVCTALLLLSFMAPVQTLSSWPAMAGMGQNALLAIAMFAIWQSTGSVVNRMSGHSLLLILSAALAFIVIAQTALQWFPHDGWHRLLVNTVSAAEAWQGRMSGTEAYLLLLLFSVSLLLKSKSPRGVIFSGIAIASVSLLTASRASTFYLGIADITPELVVLNTLNPLAASLLFLMSLAMARQLISHPIYLGWETDNPGYSAFFKVAALIFLLLVGSAALTLAYARHGYFNSAVLVFLLLSVLVLHIIHIRIVAAVDGRRRVELVLREREAALRKAQSVSHLGSWRFFLPEGNLEWSEECCLIFGVDYGNRLTLDEFMSFIHPEDQALVQHSWHRALEGDVYDIEHRIIVAGQTKWVRERADFQWQNNKTQCTCLGTVQDITDSKLKEMELLRSRNLIRKLAAHNEKIREQERARIAQELHDEMGQHLTALRLQTAMVQSDYGIENDKLYEQLKDIKGKIDNTIAVVRAVAASLRPPALDAGLVAACNWLLENFVEKAGIATRLESTIDGVRMGDEIEIAAFRILQESLTNVVRHSNATEVLVWISVHGNELAISVTDNGSGFALAECDMDMHFGLVGIRERALSFGGVTAIKSAPGKGCCISVTLSLW